MQKHRAHYNRAEIKAFFADCSELRNVTASARRTIRQLRFSDQDVLKVIQCLNAKDFYKSMTTYHDHQIWQDVYHIRHHGIELYVKLTKNPEGSYWLLSFKKR